LKKKAKQNPLKNILNPSKTNHVKNNQRYITVILNFIVNIKRYIY